MNLIKKHVDTVIVLGGILGATLWMNGKFNSFEKEMAHMEKDIVIIKTVLLMRGILPNDLVCNDGSMPVPKDKACQSQ